MNPETLPPQKDSQEAIAERSREIAEQAPGKILSAQRSFAEKLKTIVVDDLAIRGKSMPNNAQEIFKKVFSIRPDIPAQAETLKRMREETVTAVGNSLERGAISTKDIDPSHAIDPITIGSKTVSYRGLLDQVKKTLAVSVRGKNIESILVGSGMSKKEAAASIEQLAASIARARRLDRFVGDDLLGVRSAKKPLHEKGPARPQEKAVPKKLASLNAALLSIGARPPEGRTSSPITSEESRKKAYEILGEMAKHSSVEVPIKIGQKVRSVALIIAPRHERDADNQLVEGGAEWLEIKRAFHVLEPKGERTEKRFEPTNLVKDGVPNGLVVKTPDDIPEPIMEGLRAWGFSLGKEEAFEWLIMGGKEGEQRWRERMNIDTQQKQTPTE